MQLMKLLEEYNSRKRYYEDKDDAMIEFIKQKQAIDWIKNTKWFKVIREYRQKIVISWNERFRTMKTDKELMRTQWELDLAMQFLDFLDNILAEELSKEDLDILKSN